MNRLIDADNFLIYLIFSKYIDEATCGEIKNVIEHYTVDAIPRYKIDEMIAEIKEMGFGVEVEGWEAQERILRVIHKYCDKEQNNE